MMKKYGYLLMATAMIFSASSVFAMENDELSKKSLVVSNSSKNEELPKERTFSSWKVLNIEPLELEISYCVLPPELPYPKKAVSLTSPVREAFDYATKGNIQKAHKVLASIPHNPDEVAMEILHPKSIELPTKVILELMEPYVKKTTPSNNLYGAVIEEYSGLLLTLPYDSKRYSFAEECLDKAIQNYKAPASLLKNDFSYRKMLQWIHPIFPSISSDPKAEIEYDLQDLQDLQLLKTCFMIYRNASKDKIQNVLKKVVEVDFEDLTVLLSTLRYRGLSNISGKSRKIIQYLILRGFESDCKKVHESQDDSSYSLENYKEIWCYKDVMEILFKGADKETLGKHESMRSYLKTQAKGAKNKKLPSSKN